MRRRDFIAGIGGAAAWPVVARGQAAIPVIGFLSARSAQGAEQLLAAYKEGLSETGYVIGQNVAVEYRWAEGQYERLPVFAADLANRRVDVIGAFGGDPAVLAAKGATTTIPIVFTTGTDPVATGLVKSLARPGGNLTGVHMFSGGLEAKRLGLLRELVPSAAAIAVLTNPAGGPGEKAQLSELQSAAQKSKQPIQILNAQNRSELDLAFANIGKSESKALLVMADPFLNNEQDKIISLAAHYSIPAIYDLREFALAGGLMSYGTSLINTYRQAGVYCGRILKGANPADLPVLQSTKFEFVLNLKTANALGIEVPPAFLARADEVIE